jgi:hypothetical protein
VLGLGSEVDVSRVWVYAEELKLDDTSFWDPARRPPPGCPHTCQQVG